MKKIPAFILLLMFFIFLSIPFPNQSDGGGFNSISGLWWCRTDSACIHEIAHRLDWEAGWISNKHEFKEAVITYVLVEAQNGHPSRIATNIMAFRGVYDYNPFRITSAELYAYIFEWSGGKEENMPEIFRKFYDWNRALELMKK